MSAGYCLNCDYPLQSVAEARCPECGRRFDPQRPGTFALLPGARRRRWARRSAWTLGALAAVWVLLPRHVTRLTLSWPNADGVTMGSRTTWVLQPASWLPIPGPRWSGGVTTRPLPAAGQYPIAEKSQWAWRGVRYSRELSYTVRIPPQAGFVGCLSVALPGSPPAGPRRDIPIQPENLDEAVDVLMSGANATFSSMRAPAPVP